MRIALVLPLAAVVLAGTGTAVAATNSASADRAGSGKRGAFVLELSGDAVPGGRDEEADGVARLKFDPKRETLCLATAWKDLAGSVTAMHLHKGVAGKTGDHHIEILDDEHLAGGNNMFGTCVQVQGHMGHTGRELIEAVLDDPEGYYLNVHSTKYPKGALRGQLGDRGGWRGLGWAGWD